MTARLNEGVPVLWLYVLLSLAAISQLIAASLSCVWLGEYARLSRSPGRSVAVGALLMVCAALALEAALFLSEAPVTGGWTRVLATILVRCALVSSTVAIAALLW